MNNIIINTTNKITITSDSYLSIYKDNIIHSIYNSDIVSDINTIVTIRFLLYSNGLSHHNHIIINPYYINQYDYMLLYTEKFIFSEYHRAISYDEVYNRPEIKKNTFKSDILYYVKDKKTLSKIKLIQTITPNIEINLNDYRLINFK
ncbi:MAG: hypothetical protein [Caudoviricetes sp.]|nr:MAG: hypothetical protein [Caudoviricetes sp.]